MFDFGVNILVLTILVLLVKQRCEGFTLGSDTNFLLNYSGE